MDAAEFDFALAQLESACDIVYSALNKSAEINWPLLSARCGTQVWVKHENHLPTGAFKVRGGLVFAHDMALKNSAGVIAATRGNHGQSVAFAARRHGIKAVVVVPIGNNLDKNRAMRALGSELIEHGRDFDAAFDYAEQLAVERGLMLFPSFHPSLVRGVATYALELMRAVSDLHTVYAPIGLGSGICGLIAARDALGLKTRIVGVVASSADAYAQSFAAGRVIGTDSADTIADGVAVRIPNPIALEIMSRGLERVVRVSEVEIEQAIAAYYHDTHNVAEGAGAASLAALLAESKRYNGQRIGLVLSGGNIDAAQFARILNTHRDN